MVLDLESVINNIEGSDNKTPCETVEVIIEETTCEDKTSFSPSKFAKSLANATTVNKCAKTELLKCIGELENSKPVEEVIIKEDCKKISSEVEVCDVEVTVKAKDETTYKEYFDIVIEEGIESGFSSPEEFIRMTDLDVDIVESFDNIYAHVYHIYGYPMKVKKIQESKSITDTTFVIYEKSGKIGVVDVTL